MDRIHMEGRVGLSLGANWAEVPMSSQSNYRILSVQCLKAIKFYRSVVDSGEKIHINWHYERKIFRDATESFLI